MGTKVQTQVHNTVKVSRGQPIEEELKWACMGVSDIFHYQVHLKVVMILRKFLFTLIIILENFNYFLVPVLDRWSL